MKNANLKIFELLSPKYERDNIKLGLSRIKKVLQELGNPCKNIPAIQIIGTNGKGSIAAYLESILFEAKRNFGVTTSPHLLDVCESCLLYTSPSPRDVLRSRMPSAA